MPRIKALGRVQLLIPDDWGLSVFTVPERRDLLEILHDRASTKGETRGASQTRPKGLSLWAEGMPLRPH